MDYRFQIKLRLRDKDFIQKTQVFKF